MNIYKASITGDAKDIHRSRLDVKKIFALYGLFEMLDPKTFKRRAGFRLFKTLFRQAGIIREIQVNCLLVEGQPAGIAGLHSFIVWLRVEERFAVQKFLQMVKRFRESELAETEKLIRRICKGSSNFRLKTKTNSYVRNKALKVNELVSREPDTGEIHKIRQHLKAMSAIVNLAHSVKPGERLELLIALLDKTEILIGDWHDRMVLMDTIDWYQELYPDIPPVEIQALNLLKQGIKDQNLLLVQQFMPGVVQIVKEVLSDEK